MSSVVELLPSVAPLAWVLNVALASLVACAIGIALSRSEKWSLPWRLGMGASAASQLELRVRRIVAMPGPECAHLSRRAGLGVAAVAVLMVVAIASAQIQVQAIDKHGTVAEKLQSPSTAANSDRPPLDELMKQLAEYERAYFPFRVKSIETFRMSEDLTANERSRYPWGDGRKHGRWMEYAQKADWIWFRKETHVLDDVPQQPRYETYSDGERQVQLNLRDRNPIRQPEVFVERDRARIAKWASTTPSMGIFPLMTFSNGDLLTRIFPDGRQLQLDWDGDDARLTFEFGPGNIRSRYELWLSHDHEWHPAKLRRYLLADAKLFYDEWSVTKFMKQDGRWRVMEGTIRYRDLRDAASADAKVMYYVDFKVLEAEWGQDLADDVFAYKIPAGANVHEREPAEAKKPPAGPTREIAIRVVDIEDQPVSDADVRFSNPKDGSELDSLVTDAQGVARTAKAPQENVAIRVAAAGFRPATWVIGGETKEHRVILAPQTRGVAVDERGTPVATAWITSDSLSFRADGLPDVPHGQHVSDSPDWSDERGRFELRKSLTLRNVQTPVLLIAIDESAERMAWQFLSSAQLAQPQQLVMKPVCMVRGACLLEGMNERTAVSAAILADNGRQIGGAASKTTPTPEGLRVEFQLRLPEGKYSLQARRSSLYPPFAIPIVVAAGQRELDLGTIGAPAAGTVALKNKPAPELRVRWRDGQASSLEKLRGRIVVLDFWGTWCGPCIAAMPRLIDIAEQFKDRPVEWLAIHTPSEADFEEFDREIADLKQRSWNNRDLPFTTVIDLPIPEGDRPGQTAQRFGVVEWPTIILIDQEGKVVGAVAKENLAEVIQRLLDDGRTR